MKKIDYKGDGLLFFNECSNSELKKLDIQLAMGIKSTGTFFGLYKKTIFTPDERAAAARALGKPVNEIFPPIEKTYKSYQNKGEKDHTEANESSLDYNPGLNPGDDNLMISKLFDMQERSTRALEDISAAFRDVAKSNLILARLAEQRILQPEDSHHPVK